MTGYVLWIILAQGQPQSRQAEELKTWGTKEECLAAGWGWLAAHRVKGQVSCRKLGK
jgi:hypothetical protein